MSSILLLAALASAGTERFAVIAGSNDGGPERATLRYADSDATDIAGVLGSLGGLSDDHTTVLLDTNPEQIRGAIDALTARVAAATEAGSRTEVFFYYSGHSDELGLLPAGDRYDYADLRERLKAVGADAQLVILDSCASGAMFRTKGGTLTAPFLQDASVDVKGHAYLTSSAEDEVAQESDAIGASYFTHYLVSGLRGAADTSGDGRVTLGEVYQFTKDETLARTERSLAGPQHPSWELQLTGSGDLVVTSLDATIATLHVPEGVRGRLFVRDTNGDLVAELSKAEERSVVLGMSPGDYSVLLVDGEDRWQATFTLLPGETVTLADVDFYPVDGEDSRVRGDAPAEEYAHVGVDPMIVPTRRTFEGSKTIVTAGVGLIAHHADRVEGAQISLGANIASESVRGAQLSIGANHAGSTVTGGQMAVGVNVAGDDVSGMQWTVGANIADGDVQGAQAAVGGNFAHGDVTGVQGAVGANVATGEMTGVQAAVGVNVAPRSNGVQASAGVNVSDQHKGLQVGLVNVGRKVDGLQLGLVNIAEDADESIALIPINAAGYNHLILTSNESDHLDLGATFGGKHLYTTARYGMRVQEGDLAPRHTVMLGLGVHAGNKLFVDTDVAVGSWFEGLVAQESVVVHGRVGLGLELVKGFALVGGPTVNTIPWRGAGASAYRATGLEGNTVRPNRWGWVGLFAGIRLL